MHVKHYHDVDTTCLYTTLPDSPQAENHTHSPTAGLLCGDSKSHPHCLYLAHRQKLLCMFQVDREQKLRLCPGRDFGRNNSCPAGLSRGWTSCHGCTSPNKGLHTGDPAGPVRAVHHCAWQEGCCCRHFCSTGGLAQNDGSHACKTPGPITHVVLCLLVTFLLPVVCGRGTQLASCSLSPKKGDSCTIDALPV